MERARYDLKHFLLTDQLYATGNLPNLKNLPKIHAKGMLGTKTSQYTTERFQLKKNNSFETGK
jgi:hypothetical protein